MGDKNRFRRRFLYGLLVLLILWLVGCRPAVTPTPTPTRRPVPTATKPVIVQKPTPTQTAIPTMQPEPRDTQVILMAAPVLRPGLIDRPLQPVLPIVTAEQPTPTPTGGLQIAPRPGIITNPELVRPLFPTATPTERMLVLAQLYTKEPLLIDYHYLVPTPAKLATAETWQPYALGSVVTTGFADLQPGYEPMRLSVDTMKASVSQSYLGTLLQINTARTVVLKETALETIQETVSIAPVAATDPNALDPRRLEEMLRAEGVVLGMLQLDTNAPGSRVPSGAYLERARVYGSRGFSEGVIELIDAETGRAVYRVGLLAAKVEGAALEAPSAMIYKGTKWCVTALLNWHICRPCFFWEPEPLTLDECRTLLPTPTP